ncbi:hypothetical protein [Methylophaga sp.]|uniref:hypothetical protein n=1 Tax=Methylophaga sp. TaxID=2024840 RepID=UPI003A9174F4
MPNTFAYIALLSWPFVTFFLLRKYGIGPGSLISLLAAYMFLPASFSINLPGLPDPDKFSITTFTILCFILLRGGKLGFGYLDKRFKLLLLLFIISPFVTAITNQERYLHLPGLTLYDGFSNSVISFLEFIPFLIGLTYFREEKDQFRLFKYFALASLVYAFLALYEIRMSPQLHNIVYGYFPHSWIQQYRSGGFRAVVFMGHGLLVAMFLALGVVFWASLKQAKYKVFRYSNTFGLAVVFITLLLSKSLAALIYGLFAVIFIRFFKSKQIYFASVLMALIFITYPISSATGLFPHGMVVNLASEISTERAGSLDYRFRNESMLLDRASEKSLFGWGTWGRNRIYDLETGEDISVTDGEWIIKIGTSGWLGFLSTYLFLFLPVWIAFRRNKQMKFTSQQSQILFSGHCLAVGLLMIDQLPNASFNPLYWCLAGSLLGRAQSLLSSGSNVGNKTI